MDQYYAQILRALGEDPNREGLLNTPQRAARALEFLTQGMRQNLDEIVNGAIFEVEANHMVIVKDIEIYSLCEHHMLPFFGRCHIGYVPNGKVLGVSKLARIADLYARRLQVQERLTNQVARAIMDIVRPDGVGVVIEAKHLCMMMRGVEKQTSNMVTSAMLGIFRHYEATRTEFLDLVRG
jgi:GTP cyclohydrolase I